MSKGFIDTHCHLNYKELGEYGQESLLMLKEAKQVGVDLIIDISVNLEDAKEALSFSSSIDDSGMYPRIYNNVAIHPLYTDGNENLTVEDFTPYLNNKQLVGIGETGLDYHYSTEKMDIQKKLFELHLQVACENNLPVNIHTRDAHDDTIDMLSYYVKNAGLRGIIHYFTADKSIAKRYLDIGFFLSYSGVVTFKNATIVQESAIYTPSNRILSETDAPYAAPVPYRGKVNKPIYVKNTVEFLAQLRGQSIQSMTDCIKDNTLNLFKKIIL